MFYPASATIADNHPDLAKTVVSLDDYLHSLADVPISVDTTADLLDEDADVLARLFRLYQDQGVLSPVSRWLCPNDLDVLQPDEDGTLWCEICETAYDLDAALELVGYEVCQPGRPQAVAPARSAPHSHALIVGVGGYRELPRLATTVRDAVAVAEFLSSPTGAGYAKANVHLLLEQQADALRTSASPWSGWRVTPHPPTRWSSTSPATASGDSAGLSRASTCVLSIRRCTICGPLRSIPAT